MKIEELREKLKYVYDTIRKLHEHSIFGGKLRPYCNQNDLVDGSVLYGLYFDKEDQGIDVIMELYDSGIVLTIKNKLWLEVTDKVRLETMMRVSEVKEYLEDFFNACENANSEIESVLLQRQTFVQKQYEKGEYLLELL